MGGCVSAPKAHGLHDVHRSLSLPTLHSPQSNHQNIDFSRSIPNNSNDHSDLNSSYSFLVSTVNARGKQVTGTLEITQNELILRPSRGAPIKWPLNYLRRYGHDGGVFSIESGRRCTSGPGLFTFASAQAEQLFQLVQRRIEDASASALHCNTLPLIVRRNTSNGSPIDRHEHDVSNGYVQTHNRRHCSDGDVEEAHHQMVDIGAPQLNEPGSKQHCYVNVGVAIDVSTSSSVTPAALSKISTSTRNASVSCASPDEFGEEPPYENQQNADFLAMLSRRFGQRRQSHLGIRATCSMNDATSQRSGSSVTSSRNAQHKHNATNQDRAPLTNHKAMSIPRSQTRSTEHCLLSLTPSTTSSATLVDYVTLNLNRKQHLQIPNSNGTLNNPATKPKPGRSHSDSDAPVAGAGDIVVENGEEGLHCPTAPYAIVDSGRTQAMLSLNRHKHNHKQTHNTQRARTAAI